MDINTYPTGYPITILNLGDNDGFYNVDIDQFRERYQLLADQADELYCILPIQRIPDIEPYRQVVKEICSNTIDLWQCGFKSRASDNIHGNYKDHWESYKNCFQFF